MLSGGAMFWKSRQEDRVSLSVMMSSLFVTDNRNYCLRSRNAPEYAAFRMLKCCRIRTRSCQSMRTRGRHDPGRYLPEILRDFRFPPVGSTVGPPTSKKMIWHVCSVCLSLLRLSCTVAPWLSMGERNSVLQPKSPLQPKSCSVLYTPLRKAARTAPRSEVVRRREGGG